MDKHYPEQSLNDSQALLKDFLEAMPEISVDTSLLPTATLDLPPHDYIVESFGNYLTSLNSLEEVEGEKVIDPANEQAKSDLLST